MLAITILAPVGIDAKKDNIVPNKKHKVEIIALKITSDLKLFVILLDIIAGNTIKLDIIKVPTILIPITTTKAVIIEIRNL